MKLKCDVGTFEVPGRRLDTTQAAAKSYRTERMLSRGFGRVPIFSCDAASNQSEAET